MFDSTRHTTRSRSWRDGNANKLSADLPPRFRPSLPQSPNCNYRNGNVTELASALGGRRGLAVRYCCYTILSSPSPPLRRPRERVLYLPGGRNEATKTRLAPAPSPRRFPSLYYRPPQLRTCSPPLPQRPRPQPREETDFLSLSYLVEAISKSSRRTRPRPREALRGQQTAAAPPGGIRRLCTECQKAGGIWAGPRQWRRQRQPS